MRLKVLFGLAEPPREVYWWNGIRDFPTLILYKNKKWEFGMYNEDPAGKFDYICNFFEVAPHDPNFHSTEYRDIENMFAGSNGPQCECGAAYSEFTWDHFRYCPKWLPWEKV